jgi:hypothetical protein
MGYAPLPRLAKSLKESISTDDPSHWRTVTISCNNKPTAHFIKAKDKDLSQPLPTSPCTRQSRALMTLRTWQRLFRCSGLCAVLPWGISSRHFSANLLWFCESQEKSVEIEKKCYNCIIFVTKQRSTVSDKAIDALCVLNFTFKNYNI